MYFYVRTIILHTIVFYRLIFTGEKEDNMPIFMSFILGVADKKSTEWCYCIRGVMFCLNFYCHVYVFLLLCMLCSVYSVFIVPTGILRLP